MNRRSFHRTLAGIGLGAGLTGLPLFGGAPATEAKPTQMRPRYKVSIMLWTVFNHLPFEQRLEKVAEAGYHAVELVNEYKNWTDADYKRVLAKRRSLGITFDTAAATGHGVANPAERNAFLSSLKQHISICQRLECPSIIVMSGNIVPSLSHEQQYKSCVEGLKRAAELAASKKMTLLLENIDQEENPNYFLKSVAEGFEIIREVNQSNVKLLYDFYHEQIAEGNLIEKLEKNIKFTGLCHIADVPGRHQPGTGEIHYINIYKKLVELGYDRYIAMEFMPTHDPVATLQKARLEALRA